MSRQRTSLLVALSVLSWAVGSSARAASFVVTPTRHGTADVTLLGPIESDDDTRLAEALSTASDHGLAVSRLRLVSPGGSARGAVLLALRVREDGIATDVPARAVCASSCFVVFASGRHRTAGGGAVIGVHRSTEQGVETSISARADASLANVLRTFDVPGRIIDRMLSTPSHGVYVLGRADLAAMHVGREPVVRTR